MQRPIESTPDWRAAGGNRIAVLEARIAARPYGGETLWRDYAELAALWRLRAEHLEAQMGAMRGRGWS